jgi:type I restriction enzyme, S subunit
MIADLKPYPEYKDSGLPWLGKIPSHWKVARNGSLFGQRNDTGHERLAILEVSLRTGVRVREFEGSKRKQIMSDLRKYKRAGEGDVAYNMMRMWQGAVGVSPVDGLVSPAYVVARPFAHADSRYFVALFRTPGYLFEIDSCSRGIVKDRNRLYWDQFKQMMSPCPPPEEQAAIVRFLDWANGRLERAIRAKRKVIALLNEQKQAIIHRAVTRGLDPSVPLKPSGIPWLGDIPAHWEVRRIKYLLREVDERSTTGEEPLLSMRMHHGLVLFAEHFSRPPQAATLRGFKIVRPGQFVVNRMQAGNGVIFASTLTGLVSPDYAVFDSIGGSNVDFLGELFRSRKVRAKFRAESKGLGTGTSGFLRLYNDRLGAIHVALPPYAEQCEILSRLVGELSGANTAVSCLEREIELLRQYRTRLIADAVTGKLDLREAITQLPHEALLSTGDEEADFSMDPEVAGEDATE